MARYAGSDVTLEQVLQASGGPPVPDLEGVNTYLLSNYGMSLVRRDNASFTDILARIRAGDPVMVVQGRSVERAGIVYRLVVGRRQLRREVLTCDMVSSSVAFQSLDESQFELLWDRFDAMSYGYPSEYFYYVIE